MAVVSCPECSKKLKVADTSLGKKVKCSCGKIFIAALEEVGGGALAALAEVTPEKVFVACTSCMTRLKVATTSVGKRMRCPKCKEVFLAALEEDSAVRPKATARSARGHDDTVALMGFAQQEEQDNANQRAVAKRSPASAKSKAVTVEKGATVVAGPVVTPGHPIITTLSLLLTLAYIGLFAVIFLGIINVAHYIDVKPRAVARPPVQVNNAQAPPKAAIPVEPKEEVVAAPSLESVREKEAQQLDILKKMPPPEGLPNVLAVIPTEAQKIDALVFSPAGSTVVSANQDDGKVSIHFWDLDKLGPSREPIASALKSIDEIKLSPNGATLALLSRQVKENDLVELYRVKEGRLIKSMDPTEGVHDLAFAPDSVSLLFISRNAENAKSAYLRFEDFTEKKFVEEVKEDKAIHFVAVPTGDRLVEINDKDKEIAIYQWQPHGQAGVREKTLGQKFEKSINALRAAVSPDAKWLVHADGNDDNATLTTFDLQTGTAGALADSKGAKLATLRFSPDSKYLSVAVKNGDWTTKIYDLKDMKVVASLPGESALAFSPGGTFIARSVVKDGRAAIHLMALAEIIGPATKKE